MVCRRWKEHDESFTEVDVTESLDATQVGRLEIKKKKNYSSGSVFDTVVNELNSQIYTVSSDINCST